MLKCAFLLASITLFLQSVFSPPFVLLAFAPWIALVCLSTEIPKSLALCLLGGCLIDLLSEDPMGVHALNYTLVAYFLSRFRTYFSHENPLHLAVFTMLISTCSTLLQFFLLFLFDRRVPFTGEWILGDLFIMPIADGVYALLGFAYPLMLYKKVLHQGSYLWLKLKKRVFPTSL